MCARGVEYYSRIPKSPSSSNVKRIFTLLNSGKEEGRNPFSFFLHTLSTMPSQERKEEVFTKVTALGDECGIGFFQACFTQKLLFSAHIGILHFYQFKQVFFTSTYITPLPIFQLGKKMVITPSKLRKNKIFHPLKSQLQPQLLLQNKQQKTQQSDKK